MRARPFLALLAAGVLVGGCFAAPPNTPPTVHAQASAAQAAVGEEVIFTGTALDAEGSVVRFDWDFEDDGVVDFTNAARGAAVHAYSLPGTYFARFTAHDDRGLTAFSLVTVFVIARFTIRADCGPAERGARELPLPGRRRPRRAERDPAPRVDPPDEPRAVLRHARRSGLQRDGRGLAGLPRRALLRQRKRHVRGLRGLRRRDADARGAQPDHGL